MSNGNGLLQLCKTIGVALTLGVSMSACSDSASWKEEVQLHDGSKIVITRSQVHGGRGELGQSPIKEQTVNFTLPSSNKLITWKSEYSDDVGRSNFNLKAIHVLKGTPYIVASPNLCLSYNKWGRPNPPYVYFKFVGNTWQRIKLEELPQEFVTFNVVQNNMYQDEKKLVKLGYVTAEMVKELNGKPEFNNIQREPDRVPVDPERGSNVGCEVMVRVEGGWESPGGAKAPLPMQPMGNLSN